MLNKKIHNHAGKLKFYPTGEYINNEYISEFFGIRFPANNGWEFVSQEWLEEFTRDKRESLNGSFLEALEERGMIDENIREWVDTLYLQVEMCACYNVNEKTYGDVRFTIFDPIDYEDSSMTHSNNTAEMLSQMSQNVSCEKRKLYGKTYNIVSGLVRDENTAMSIRYYIIKKDFMFLEILCRAFEGHEYVFDKFEKQLGKYRKGFFRSFFENHKK